MNRSFHMIGYRSRAGIRSRRSSFRRLAPAVAATLLAMSTLVPAADITSTWIGNEGSWMDPTQWKNTPPMPGYPDNNRGSLTYDAALPGSSLVTISGVSIAVDTLNVAGELAVSDAAELTVLRGLALDGGRITLGGNGGPNTWLLIRGTQTLSGTGEIRFWANPSSNNCYLASPAGDLTIGSGVALRSVRGHAAIAGGIGLLPYPYAIHNEGTISAGAPGQALNIVGTAWTNSGLIESVNNSFLVLHGTWSNTGVIDVNSWLFVDGTQAGRDVAYEQVIDQLRGARNAKWAATGITSSAARSDPSGMTGLAAILNDNGDGAPIFTHFASGTQAATEDFTIVKYTWNGDANLDGIVNADDYFLADSGYITQKKGWYNGDFNYDGIINADDYFLIDSAYIAQSAVLWHSHSPIPIPEPAFLSCFAVAALFALTRRYPRTRCPHPV